MKLCVLCLFPVNYKEKKTIEKCACEQVNPEIEFIKQVNERKTDRDKKQNGNGYDF